MTSEELGAAFDEHHERLYRLARRLSRDPEEARDLLQETFLRAARRLERMPGGEAAGPWLVRTLVNLCRDLWRRRKVRALAAEEGLPRSAAPPDPESAALARSAVQAALQRLAPRRRAVVALCELEGLDTAEAARQLGIARVTVRWHLAAARRELRAILQGRPPADPDPQEVGP